MRGRSPSSPVAAGASGRRWCGPSPPAAMAWRSTAMRRCAEARAARRGAGRPPAVEALAVTANLREEGAVRALMHRVADRFGRIDLVGGHRPDAAALGSSRTSLAATCSAHFDANVVGTFVVAQEAAAVMVRQEAGGLIDRAGRRFANQAPTRFAYATSQAAIPGLIEALAADVAARHPRLRGPLPSRRLRRPPPRQPSPPPCWRSSPSGSAPPPAGGS